MKRIPVEEFIAEGTALFGAKGRDWQFRCPGCGGVQTPMDFVNLGVPKEDALDRASFNCIGRLTGATRGCDWTLGGLLQIHKVEVTQGEEVQRCFEFATPENAPKRGFRGMGKQVAPDPPRKPRKKAPTPEATHTQGERP